jgi:transposase
MNSITYIGLDVHTTNYTICAYTIENDKAFAETTINPNFKELEKYLKKIQELQGGGKLICGYEAGCLGYSLYQQLTAKGYECIILAPTTMPKTAREIKTDRRDARWIAKCLAFGTYSKVYVPSDEDNAVKEYIRMRDDAKIMLKQTKQQIIAFCTRHGKRYDGKCTWTQRHMQWLSTLDLGSVMLNETLAEYLITLAQLTEKIERFDKRIEEIASQERYAENAGKLQCFKGIKTHTALSFLAEIGDFKRFPTAEQFASFLGLVPGEHSSGEGQHRLGITKAGNTHLRRLLVEAANCYNRGTAGKKSKRIIQRQQGNAPEVIAYADRANDRLRRKYIKLALKRNSNIAKTAVARELACFIWGMMNGKIS